MTLNPSNTHGQVECSVSVVTVTLNPIHTDRVFCESGYHSVNTEPDTHTEPEHLQCYFTNQNNDTEPQDAHRHVEKKP